MAQTLTNNEVKAFYFEVPIQDEKTIKEITNFLKERNIKTTNPSKQERLKAMFGNINTSFSDEEVKEFRAKEYEDFS
ncbi:MAG: hypothetical protein GX282_08035 [Campylobacteraceae bacterium]|nr:hypothetical protein [Campylobacteraceae bacterium]